MVQHIDKPTIQVFSFNNPSIAEFSCGDSNIAIKNVENMSALFAHFSNADVVHLLAFVGGFVDAAGYIKIRGVFTSSITGNLVVACASVSSLNGVICRSCVSIAFAAGAGVSAMLALKLRLANRINLKYLAMILFALEIGMLVISWAVGIRLDDAITNSINLDEWPVVLLGCFLGAAMGFHNVAAKESITGCPPTTVMTSTLINVSSGLANSLGLLMASFGMIRLTPPNGPKGTYLRLTKAEKDALFQLSYNGVINAMPLVRPLISFLVGAIIGAVTTKYGTFHCLAIPVALLILIQFEIVLQIFNENSKELDSKATSEKSEQLMIYSLSLSGTNVILKSEINSDKSSDDSSKISKITQKSEVIDEIPDKLNNVDQVNRKITETV